MEATDKGYALVIAEILICLWKEGIVERLYGHTPAEETHICTFESSINGLYRLDYILHSSVFCSYDVSANDELDLGSDHRNVSASFEILRSFKGWKPKLNNSREPEI